MESTIQLDLFSENLIIIKKVRKPHTGGRAKDSSGRFAAEIDLPGKAEFREIQQRKDLSISVMLRILTEENHQLKEQLKKYEKDG